MHHMGATTPLNRLRVYHPAVLRLISNCVVKGRQGPRRHLPPEIVAVVSCLVCAVIPRTTETMSECLGTSYSKAQPAVFAMPTGAGGEVERSIPRSRHRLLKATVRGARDDTRMRDARR